MFCAPVWALYVPRRRNALSNTSNNSDKKPGWIRSRLLLFATLWQHSHEDSRLLWKVSARTSRNRNTQHGTDKDDPCLQPGQLRPSGLIRKTRLGAKGIGNIPSAGRSPFSCSRWNFLHWSETFWPHFSLPQGRRPPETGGTCLFRKLAKPRLKPTGVWHANTFAVGTCKKQFRIRTEGSTKPTTPWRLCDATTKVNNRQQPAAFHLWPSSGVIKTFLTRWTTQRLHEERHNYQNERTRGPQVMMLTNVLRRTQ